MDIEQAIRTHKAFRPEPIDGKTLDELSELARWAPNHHRTNPCVSACWALAPWRT
jgi:nitroreductase